MRIIAALLVAAGLLFVATGPATASVNIYLNPVVGNTASFAGGAGWSAQAFYYAGGGPYYGGPFIGTLNTGASWTTFCVEADGGDERISLGPTYWVSNLDSHVAIATQNYVTDEAKWLYWQYGNGLLPATLANNEGWTVNDLQVAIWHGVWAHGVVGTSLEMTLAGGGSAYGTAAQDLYGLAHDALTTGSGVAQAGAEANSVYVLSPADGGVNGTQVQSMLYAIPEPATIVVWSLLGAGTWLGMRVSRRGRRVGRQPWSNENRTAILEIVGRR
jgi:hypothetical protein